ncbi:hypothetical protein M9Y10_026488 [Tritrichomonas musculus]|uniref:Protein kinase domain-containing protein n=1 Tax=Tritrichomonas musculus TaxID=1915356 RepID=A0ABR2GJF1_9EUKA
MIKSCGCNDHFQLCIKPNKKGAFGTPCNSPPSTLDVDASSVSSFSSCFDHSVMITLSGEILAIGDNRDGRISGSLPKKELTEFTKYELKDSKNRHCIPISAVCGFYYTLYLVTIKGTNKNYLAYSSSQIESEYPVILDIGNKNPIALYGGYYNAAAIDTEGSIIYIPSGINASASKITEASRLPGSEKAVSIAVLEYCVFALGESGKVFYSEIASGKLSFAAHKELEGIKISQISGARYSGLAVSDDHRIFVLGGDRGTDFSKFSSLKKYKITSAYRGVGHSFFITEEGRVLARGDNGLGELALNESGPDISEPVETTIAGGCSFCIAGNGSSFIFIGDFAARSPNRRVARFTANSEPGKKGEIDLATENAKLKEENESLKKEVASLKKRLEGYEKQTNIRSEKKGENCELQIYDVGTIENLTRLGTIGRGGQSEVVKVCRQEIYALKVLETELNELKKKVKIDDAELQRKSYESMKRFLQEYEIMNSLHHRNIIKAYGLSFGDASHAPCILLEYCPFNLKDVVNDLSNNEKVTVIYELSEAMKEVHSHGMIHRDLKPENVLLDGSKHVKLTDFGVSCIADVTGQAQSKTAGLGTLKFMAPELLQESTHYDEKVDVYSFGVVAFFILTGGELPRINIVEAAMGKKAAIPSCVNGVSREMINKCWELKPEERPSFEWIVEMIRKKEFKLIDGVEKHISEIKAFLSI